MLWFVSLIPQLSHVNSSPKEQEKRFFKTDPEELFALLIDALKKRIPEEIYCEDKAALSVALSAAYSFGAIIEKIRWKLPGNLHSSSHLATIRLDHIGLATPRIGFTLHLGAGVEDKETTLTQAAKKILVGLTNLTQENEQQTVLLDEKKAISADETLLITRLSTFGGDPSSLERERVMLLTLNLNKKLRTRLFPLKIRRLHTKKHYASRITANEPISWQLDQWEMPQLKGSFAITAGPIVRING